MANVDLPCDPEICRPKLVKAMEYALTTDHTVQSIGWSGKKIFREYLEENVKESKKIDSSWDDVLTDLLSDI